MAALTDKQKTIYNFIKSKPGYLKKSAANIPVKGSVKDKQVALTKAKEFFKKKVKPLTIAEQNVIIKANNKAFDKATPAQKRVIIAEDVIIQLSSKRLKAEAGIYFDSKAIQNKLNDVGGEFELQGLIKETTEPCKVCGIGALFACEVIRNDNFKVNGSDEIAYDIHADNIKDRLKGIFNGDQLDLIETAFEKRVINDNRLLEGWHGNTELADIAIDFGRKYESDKNRLIAIMKNIIKNKGTFKP